MHFVRCAGAFAPFLPEVGSPLGDLYDRSGPYIHGIACGQLRKCAGASAAITCPAASISIRLLSPGISGFPGKRNKGLRRNAKMHSRRYRCYSCSKSRCRSADVRLLKSRDCLRRKCGLRVGVPRALQQVKSRLEEDCPRVGHQKLSGALMTRRTRIANSQRMLIFTGTVRDLQLSLAVWLFLKFNTSALAYFDRSSRWLQDKRID